MREVPAAAVSKSSTGRYSLIKYEVNIHYTNIYIALTLYVVTLAVSLSVCQGRSQWLLSTCNLGQGSHPGYGYYGYATS